jgi:hypothetical protein
MPEQYDPGVEVPLDPAQVAVDDVVVDEVPFVQAQVYAECPICGAKTGDLDALPNGGEVTIRLCDQGETPFRHGNWPESKSKSKKK